MKHLVVLALLLPTTASAGGYFFSDSGIVSLSRGGAWVAGADNQFAQRYNPAGLIKVERPTVNLGWAGVNQSVKFDARDEDNDPTESCEDADGDLVECEQVVNEASPFSVPQIGFAMPFSIGDQDFGLAFGMHSPFAPSYAYAEEGAQRYGVKDSSIYQFSFGPSLAWRPHPIVTIGAGFNMQMFWVEQTLDITTFGRADPSNDVGITLKAGDYVTPGFDVGVLIEPVEQVSIGLSMMPGSKYDASGSVGISFEGNALELGSFQDGDCELPGDFAEGDEGCQSEDGITLAIQLPMVLRAGVAVRPVPELEVEVAFVYQQWSTMTDLVVDDVDVSIINPLTSEVEQVDSQFVIPQSLHDTWSIRLGGQYRINDLLEVRAGGFYEPSAVDPEHVTVSLVDGDKIQLGGGGSFYINDEALRIDIAGAGILMSDIDITDSEVHLTNANVLNDDTVVVGNGTYKTGGWMVGLQASYAFGQRKREEM
ncbi:MAG: outer membrane protein transport protein [Proteobacteria bacterium]|nr:outer membrane protein transport protein [Pseudomonadota bacterium]